jgi:hypothetical protein
MQDRGVLAFTYFQPTCFQSGALISRDFRLSHADMLLSHDPAKTLDYTNPLAQVHMQEVYRAMRGAISGMMFDYSDDLWNLEANSGGFEDPYATSTSFYRQCFALTRSGMGSDFRIHERALYAPGADLTLGITDSQRTSPDTTMIDPAMIARTGLRWYKNRVVIGYDMDAKDIFSAWKTGSYRGTDADGRRMMLTMAYVAASRLLLPNSFREFTPQVLHDLERTFPYHTAAKSARPLDAFVCSGWPSVYDFDVSPGWHQVTLFNNTDPSEEKTVTVRLSGDTAEGALGLDQNEKYHVYDFWNNYYIGQLQGSDMLTQTLRPGEARMLSVHQVEPNPQFLSTNRHIMQGYLDLVRYPVWYDRVGILSGSARVVGGEQYEIVLALNGYLPESVSAGCHLRVFEGGKLAILSINSPNNDVVPWQVTFARSSSRSKKPIGRGR